MSGEIIYLRNFHRRCLLEDQFIPAPSLDVASHPSSDKSEPAFQRKRVLRLQVARIGRLLDELEDLTRASNGRGSGIIRPSRGAVKKARKILRSGRRRCEMLSQSMARRILSRRLTARCSSACTIHLIRMPRCPASMPWTATSKRISRGSQSSSSFMSSRNNYGSPELVAGRRCRPSYRGIPKWALRPRLGLHQRRGQKSTSASAP